MNNGTNAQSFEGLDGLRGILSIVVCLAHSWQTFIVPAEGSSTISAYIFGLSARFAVLCFFCLSGYVIALSVHKNIARIGRFSVWEYFLSRTFRIIPPLLFIMVLAYGLATMLKALGMDVVPEHLSSRPVYVSHIGQQIGCLALLCRNGDLTGYLNGPLWTLKYEIQLYTITALAAFIFFSRPALMFRLLAVAFLFVYLKGAFPMAGGSFNMQAVWYFAFGLGMSTYVFCNRFSGWKVLAIVGIALVACIGLFSNEVPSNWLTQLDISRPLILAQMAFAVASAAFILYLTRLPANHRIARLGSFSYTLYILHYPILLFLFFCLYRVDPELLTFASWIIAGCAAVAAILLSKFVSVYIENPSRHREWVMGRLNFLICKNFY